MGDIFISYKSEDVAIAEKLAHAFELKGWSVFWDRDIPPGQTFDRYIKERMDEAICMVVLWSSKSVASDWVKEEAQVGARRRILLPALIEDIDPPLGFGRIEAARLWNWDGVASNAEYDGLIGAIGRLVEPSAAPPSQPPERAPAANGTPPAGSVSTRRGRRLGPTAVVVVLIGLVSVLGAIVIGNRDTLFPGETQATPATAAEVPDDGNPPGTTPGRTRPGVTGGTVLGTTPSLTRPEVTVGTVLDAAPSLTRPEITESQIVGNLVNARPALKPPSEFSNLRRISQTDQQLTIEVDYETVVDNSGPIGVAAHVLRAGKKLQIFSYRPGRIDSQRGTTRITILLSNARAPASLVTDQVSVEMHRSGITFYKKVFPLQKQWRRAE